ncbi:unnamed protein product, partial [Ceratitis capitata]
MRTVSEELAFCQILYHNRDSRKAIEPIYEKKHTRMAEEQKVILAQRRERQCNDKKIKVKRSPSLPPTPFTYERARKNSPRTVSLFRK